MYANLKVQWHKCISSLLKKRIGMTFKNKKKELPIEVNVFLNGSRSYEIYVYTSGLSKSNRRAHYFLISKEICM